VEEADGGVEPIARRPRVIGRPELHHVLHPQRRQLVEHQLGGHLYGLRRLPLGLRLRLRLVVRSGAISSPVSVSVVRRRGRRVVR